MKGRESTFSYEAMKDLDAKKCSKQQHYAKDQQDIKIKKYLQKLIGNHKKMKHIPFQGT